MLKITVLVLTLATAARAATLNRIGMFRIQHPAFATLYEDPDVTKPEERYNLIVSSFAGPNPFSSAKDSVHLVRKPGTMFNNVNGISPELVTQSVTWPNEISAVPAGIFQEKMLAIPDGFLVPFKTKGAIKLIDITNSGASAGPYTLTPSTGSNWFYHRVEWHDMDGDGDQDIITARAREPILFGGKDEELVWLENPGGQYDQPWAVHVLTHGPDVYFRSTNLNTTDGMKSCIFTSQFFTTSLNVYWSTQGNGLYSDASMLQKRVIDDSIGRVFDVEIADLNNDGRPDLLVTTNSGTNGTVLAYEIPDDFRTGTYVKHTIAVGFSPTSHLTGKGAPGSALAINPTTADKSRAKPVILLSGDDDGNAYLFKADSEDPSNWSYSKESFYNAGSGTVGELAAADVNNDGYVDVFVPSYDQNEVIVYTFNSDMHGAQMVGR